MQSKCADRTPAQNRALHKWFRQVAEELNDAGHDPRETIKLPMRFTEHIVKDDIMVPFIEKMYGKSHTSDLTTEELKEVVRTMQMAMNIKLGITAHFPGDDG